MDDNKATVYILGLVVVLVVAIALIEALAK